MKQFLRSLWTLLLLMMWCSVGFAQTTVTFDATKDKGTSTSTTLTKDGVTLKFGDGMRRAPKHLQYHQQRLLQK